jgi:hypothetical protein
VTTDATSLGTQPGKVFEILGTLSLLTPWDVAGCGKIRIGAAADGGYVMLDRLRPDQPVFSYGVGPDSSFDAEMAARGHRVFMFDHTVQGPAGGIPPGAQFTKEGVGPVPAPERRLDTVENHLRRHGCLGRRDLILKMDVEGAEWPVLATLPDAVLDGFEQIVVELHGFQALAEDGLRAVIQAALARLNGRFTLCHVHGNAHAGIRLAEGVPVLPALEATYVRTDLVERTQSRMLFPTPLDRSNKPGTRDIVLCMYPFLPMAVPIQDFAALGRRLDAEHAAAAPVPRD